MPYKHVATFIEASSAWTLWQHFWLNFGTSIGANLCHISVPFLVRFGYQFWCHFGAKFGTKSGTKMASEVVQNCIPNEKKETFGNAVEPKNLVIKQAKETSIQIRKKAGSEIFLNPFLHRSIGH